MSYLDEISVYRPDRVVVVWPSGERLTERDLVDLKRDPDPQHRAFVDWVRQSERNEKWLAARRSR